MMFLQPRHLDAALALRAEHGPDVVTIGGGTDLIVQLNHGRLRPAGWLDLSQVADFQEIGKQDGEIVLAGGATFARIACMATGCLAAAARSVGGPQVRNRGTIAGNLATASPAGDGSTALLALDALVELAHARRGRRTLPITEFFRDYKQTALAPDELITSVRFRAGAPTGWYKIGKRGACNIAVVCCAVAQPADGTYRIALGSVGPYPMRATRAETVLAQGGLTEETIAQAAEEAMREAQPISDHRASAAYRRAMCGVLVRRLLTQLREEMGGRGKGDEPEDGNPRPGPLPGRERG